MKLTTSPFGSITELDPLPTYTWSSTPVVATQGWQCPLCHTVYAPVVPACYCRRQPSATVTTAGTTVSSPPPAPLTPLTGGPRTLVPPNGGGPEL